MSGERFVLDTSALFAFMTGEEGAAAVESILYSKSKFLFIPWPVLFEIYYVTKRTRGEKEADRRFVLIKELPASILWQMEESDVLTAARFKAQFRISFADSLIAAAAFRQNAILVHKDTEYDSLAEVIRLRSLLSRSR
jgi:predicted nucleic acid-binding protein